MVPDSLDAAETRKEDRSGRVVTSLAFLIGGRGSVVPICHAEGVQSETE